MANRAEIIHTNFPQRVLSGDLPSTCDLSLSDSALSSGELVDLFETQLMSRQLDITSRRLRARGESHYTIGSAGHEGNAVFGMCFRTTDMAFLHYRSGALLIQRSKQLPGQTPLYDMLLSFVASSDDPISGGRHKVMGSLDLLVPPQTSTIASHLPKAMGTAHAIGLSRYMPNVETIMPRDSIVLCNFGDASANHSTTQGAINAAGWASFQSSPMAIVFICEDNGIGISVSTPKDWISTNFSSRAGLTYLYCDGLNLLDTHRVTLQAIEIARKQHKPVFLHVRTIRLMGHAGSDTETGYRSLKKIEEIEAQDPLLHSARLLIENQVMSANDIVALHEEIEARVSRIAEQVISRPKLKNVKDVMSSIVPSLPHAQGERMWAAKNSIGTKDRETLFKGEERLLKKPQAMARLINLALADIMLTHNEVVTLGEDIGKKGGVYSVTTGLQKKFGPARVLDTLLDEQSILGIAMGYAHNGFLPIPEIQFLAYVHNAEDQIRGEAATLSFFSDGQFTNPMVLRIAGLAYQKGFGGHFHNDNSFNVFRDIPGIMLVCPSNGEDAVSLLRRCVEIAIRERRIIIFLEPIALYQTKDLHEEGDGLWLSNYQDPESKIIHYGELGVRGEGKSVCILSYGNGFYLSCQAQKQLAKIGIEVTVVDLRWLVPLSESAIIKEVKKCDSVLIVDECRRSGSVSEALITLLVEQKVNVPMARICAKDSFIPIGTAATLTLPNVEEIIFEAQSLTDVVKKDNAS